ncbi:MAG: helix-turn-helix domain-containing protein [Clostridia bacterium]|nr:helix-turn-helix domain-containing protein [Clostridia bacterium]
MNCGEKIAELRKKNGMTQDDLGKAMNVSYQAVSKWERDESQPDFETMSKIAKLFNVPLSYFEEGGELNSVEREEAKEEPKAEAEEEPKKEPIIEEEPKAESVSNVLGVCTVCGKMLKEGEEATTSPKIVCKECDERIKQEQQKSQEQAARQLKYEKERSAQEIIGHGFDATLIISLALALVGYIALTVVALLFSSSDDVYLYGALIFFCPLALFGLTHAIADVVNDWRDKDDDTTYTRNLSLIIGACFAVVNIAIFLVLYFVVEQNAYFLGLLGAGAVLSFTFVSQFMWDGVVKEIFTAGGFTFKLPGFIFHLSFDSIVWMIVTKFFLGILAAIIFIVTTVLVAVVAIVGSVFIFIPSVLWKTRKDHKARQSLKEN